MEISYTGLGRYQKDFVNLHLLINFTKNNERSVFWNRIQLSSYDQEDPLEIIRWLQVLSLL